MRISIFLMYPANRIDAACIFQHLVRGPLKTTSHWSTLKECFVLTSETGKCLSLEWRTASWKIQSKKTNDWSVRAWRAAGGNFDLKIYMVKMGRRFILRELASKGTNNKAAGHNSNHSPSVPPDQELLFQIEALYCTNVRRKELRTNIT